MKISKYIFLLVIHLSSCQVQSNCSLSIKISSDKIHEKVLTLNKQIIPCLIDSIDIPKTSLVGYQNPISSYINDWQINQIGIDYAYLVEYTLSYDSLVEPYRISKLSSVGNYDNICSKPILEPLTQEKKDSLAEVCEIYNIGVIVKQDITGKLILKPLTHEDMVRIKKMYLNWWKQNKGKPIETLRKEFRSGNKILKLPYVWI